MSTYKFLLENPPIFYTHRYTNRPSIDYIKCSCGEITKLSENYKEKNCSKCGKTLKIEDCRVIRDDTTFVSSVVIITDEASTSVSFTIKSIDYERYRPFFGRYQSTLKFKLHHDKRMSYAYSRWNSTENEINKNNSHFRNVTIPIYGYAHSPVFGKYSLTKFTLTGEMLDIITENMGIDFPGRKKAQNKILSNTHEVNMYDLLWLNRLRENYQINRVLHYTLEQLRQDITNLEHKCTSKITLAFGDIAGPDCTSVQIRFGDDGRNVMSCSGLYRYYKNEYKKIDNPNAHMVNRYKEIEDMMKDIRSMKRSKNNLITSTKDNSINAKALLKDYITSKNVDIDTIPTSLYKTLLAFPKYINIYTKISKFIKNNDILVNLAYRLDSYDIYNNSFNVSLKDLHEIFGRKDISDEKFTNLFEKRFSDKLRTRNDINYLADTVQMIKLARAEGIKVDLKGSMSDIHERMSVLSRKLRAPKVTFLLADTKLDQIATIDDKEYRLAYAKTPVELIEIGEHMRICVGSYSHRCLDDTLIMYMEDENGPMACMEINVDSDELHQAKAYGNDRLPNKIQEFIGEYCIKNKLMIRTHDISEKIKHRVNETLSQSVPYEEALKYAGLAG